MTKQWCQAICRYSRDQVQVCDDADDDADDGDDNDDDLTLLQKFNLQNMGVAYQYQQQVLVNILWNIYEIILNPYKNCHDVHMRTLMKKICEKYW